MYFRSTAQDSNMTELDVPPENKVQQILEKVKGITDEVFIFIRFSFHIFLSGAG